MNSVQEGAWLLTGAAPCDEQIESHIDAQPLEAVDWTGVRLQRVEYEPASKIFAQGDPATTVMYVEKGAVRLSVLSHAGKEAVLALLDVGHFFGEGCLAGQSQRMATATAIAPSTILAVEKSEMVRQLQAAPLFADRFLSHMLTRNIRIEEDLVDYNGALKVNNSLLGVVLRD